MKVLEVCVESMEDARLAVACGAGRIELCRDLSADGLTPEPHMLAEVASLPVPVMVMIRPRGGDFCYSAQEIDTMCRQIAAARVAGAAGVVTGVLTGNRQLDRVACAALLAAAGPMPVTLHRAFDQNLDLPAALETAIELGFSRILTSGGAGNALSGQVQLANLVRQAQNRITILVGGGVRAENAAQLLQITGTNELHSACRLSDSPPGQVCVDGQAVRALREVMDRFEQTP